MVTIRFKPIEVKEILLWGTLHKVTQEGAGISWDEQQDYIIKKLQRSIV